MTKILKRSLSVLLAVMMIAGIFAVVPTSASAAAVTPKYKITINNKVVINSTTLPYTTSATNLKNKAGYSSYTVSFLKVYKAKDKIGTISGQNFTITKSGSEVLDIGLKKGSQTGHITPTVTCTPLTACVCEATGYTGYYDGEPHTIGGLTVTSPESGATVKYGTVSGTYNLTEPPTFTEVGTHTVYYQISASGWVTKTGSVNVNILSSYTVTWKNDDGTTLETDTYVPKDATPEYNGNTPVKGEDEINTYTFSGWTDGTNTYGKDESLPAVTADVTYTATFTAENKAVKNVIALLNALPVDVTVNDKDQIEAARAAYDALTDDQKALVTNETLDKLTAAETALSAAEKAAADQAAADDVITQINSLPTDVTVDDKAQIEAARAAYEALTDDQKALITTETLDKLTVAETALAEAESRLNGPQDDGYFYLNDVKQIRYQLIQWHGDYYFINDGDKYAKNAKLYLTNAYVAGTGLAAGLYEFGADGKMVVKNGPDADGYFYINNAVCRTLYRFVEFEGDWYFIYDAYKYAKNARLYLSGAFLEGTDFAPGYFDFDADGKYYIPEELPEGANADGYFYINGVKQTRFQLIKYGNDYYFINDNDFYAKNTKLYLSSTYVSGTDLPAGLYEFGADGKMIISVTKNGPQDDGYFYINGARCQKLYRFVEFDGDWYFINDGYKYAKNARLYLGNAFLEGTDFAPGYFVFGADGKLVTA